MLIINCRSNASHNQFNVFYKIYKAIFKKAFSSADLIQFRFRAPWCCPASPRHAANFLCIHTTRTIPHHHDSTANFNNTLRRLVIKFYKQLETGEVAELVRISQIITLNVV